MRTMFIVKALATAAMASAKGDLSFVNPDGTLCDFLVSPTNLNRDAPFSLVNALGNGSFKTFELNPYNFNFRSQLSGSATNVVPVYSITYPTGNARTDSFTNQFTGGIVVKVLDKDKNVFLTKKLIPVEVIGAAAVPTIAEVLVAFKAAMASITGAGNYIASATHTASTSSVFTLTDTNTFISLTGDLRTWVMTKTNGSDLSVSGKSIAKLERELAPNSGYIRDTELDNPLYSPSNFIADTSVAAYDLITIETSTDAQRPLVLGSGGFKTTLHIAIDHSLQAATYDKILAFLTKLKASPSVVTGV